MQETATQRGQQCPVPGVSRILQEMSLLQHRSRCLECLLLLGEGPMVLLPQHEPVTLTPAAGRSLGAGQRQVCAVCIHDAINHFIFFFLLNFVF